MKKGSGHTQGTVRVGGRVTPEINTEIDGLAKELSISKTAVMSLIIHTGYNAISRLVRPEDFLDYKKMTAAFQDAGIDFEKALEE